MRKIHKIVSLIIVFLLTITLASQADAATKVIYQYDKSDRLLSITIPGYKITYVYDKNGNLIKRIITKTPYSDPDSD